MTIMRAWRWIRYPRIAWDDRRRTAYIRPQRELKRWQVWLYAIGALALSTAVWWPADTVDVRPAWERQAVHPTERVLPLERPSRPPHPIEIYRVPGTR